MTSVHWDIRRAGRAWIGAEFRERADLRPEKLEIWEGKLLLNEEERVKLLGLLLENVGVDRAVQLGDPAIWLGAVDALQPWWRRRSFLGDPFNRWMLALWCLNLLVIAGVIFVAIRRPDLPQMSPAAASLFLCAVVAMWTSLAVHAFLK
jgi:hypothetical protein